MKGNRIRQFGRVCFALALFLVLYNAISYAQDISTYGKFTIARLKYDGGGDWYSDPSSLPNLLKFIKENAPIDAYPEEIRVSIMDNDFFSYPYLYMTGHGNIKFSDEEVLRLRRYLQSGGFLHADDNYGMDKSFRREIKRVFPNNELIELPFNHPIFRIFYDFPEGLPKIHEHDGKPAQGFGIFYKGRLIVFYTYECDLGDGWEDPEVHGDPEEKRQVALKMGTNIILFSLMK
ncbi:MAG: DUF4159 domain-containing protein [Candidatus Marinimicrobia bacterium]|nr:DUF4159 domain-containing protein [Candidatus Neomarinimicrobiota bacterium]